MTKYILKRTLRSLVTMFIIVTVLFSLLRLMPVEGYFENYDKLAKEMLKRRSAVMNQNIPILVAAELKNNAGIIGAVCEEE